MGNHWHTHPTNLKIRKRKQGDYMPKVYYELRYLVQGTARPSSHYYRYYWGQIVTHLWVLWLLSGLIFPWFCFQGLPRLQAEWTSEPNREWAHVANANPTLTLSHSVTWARPSSSAVWRLLCRGMWQCPPGRKPRLNDYIPPYKYQVLVKRLSRPPSRQRRAHTLFLEINSYCLLWKYQDSGIYMMQSQHGCTIRPWTQKTSPHLATQFILCSTILAPLRA